MRPRLSVSARAWGTIVDELDRVAPAEGVVVPLVAVERRKGRDAPWTTATLEDVSAVRIVEVVTVPATRQHNGMASVAVMAGTDPVINAQVERIIARHPVLRAAAHLHSHPFSRGSTFASETDRRGHMIPQRRHNAACGLDTSFSFIACRAPGGAGWRLQCFAPGHNDNRAVDLGFCVVESDDTTAMMRARSPSLLRVRTRELHAWRASLRARGWTVRLCSLFDGWVRARVDVDAHRSVAVFMPIDLDPRVDQPPCMLVDRRRGVTVPIHARLDQLADVLEDRHGQDQLAAG